MWETLRQRNFALLWFAGLISMAGNWMLWIGLPVAVYELTESTLAVGIMSMASALPAIFFSSIAGVFVDRWERRRTMVVINLLLGLSILPLLLVRSADWLWLVYLVAFTQAILSQFFGPAENAMLPLLAEEKNLATANALNSLNNNLARLLGPPIGGFMAALFGFSGVVIVDALTYFVAAVLLMFITVTSRPNISTEIRTLAQSARAAVGELVEGIRIVKKGRVLRVLFFGMAITSLGEGVFGVLLIPFVTEILHGDTLVVGWLMSAQAVGGLLGGLVIGRIASKFLPYRLLGFGALGLGLIDMLIFIYPAYIPGVALAIGLFIAAGPPVIGLSVGFNTLLQTTVPDAYRGRVFGLLGTMSAIFGLVGMAAAGAGGDTLGIIPLIYTQGIVYLVVGAMCLVVLSRTRSRVVEEGVVGL